MVGMGYGIYSRHCIEIGMDMGMGMGKVEIFQETRGETGSTRCIGFFKGFGRISQESLPRGRWAHCTAKNQYRKFETNISRKVLAWPQSQFPHSCVCERFIYSNHQSAYSAAGNMWTWEYIQ
jgi:hypothetical protein